MSKYGVISGPYFHVFSLNTGKYGPEITPYLDTFHAVMEFFLEEILGDEILCNTDINFTSSMTISHPESTFNTRIMYKC